MSLCVKTNYKSKEMKHKFPIVHYFYLKVSIDEENVEQVSEALANVTSHSEITTDGIAFVALLLENITALESPSVQVRGCTVGQC